MTIRDQTFNELRLIRRISTMLNISAGDRIE